MHAKHGHVIFPTNDAPNPSKRSIKYRHGRAITESPNQPFHGGGHQLSVFSHQPSIRRKEKNRAIERPAVPLDDTDDQKNMSIAGCLSQGLAGWPRYIHSAFEIAPEILASFWGAEANPGTEVQTYGIG
jgi:hypothetical protein